MLLIYFLNLSAIVNYYDDELFYIPNIYCKTSGNVLDNF